MNDLGEQLRKAVQLAASDLEAMPEAQANTPPAPGKWSPKQIIGHLVDSASNNHGRFVRAQLGDDLFFPGYEQDDWVRVQDYASADWSSLLSLWREYNFHIARIIERIPHPVMSRPRTRHNLNEIAWQTVSADEPVTLEYFVRDYIAHLEHHLSQIPR